MPRKQQRIQPSNAMQLCIGTVINTICTPTVEEGHSPESACVYDFGCVHAGKVARSRAQADVSWLAVP